MVAETPPSFAFIMADDTPPSFFCPITAELMRDPGESGEWTNISATFEYYVSGFVLLDAYQRLMRLVGKHPPLPLPTNALPLTQLLQSTGTATRG